MKIKIINPRAWYLHKLGEILEVEEDKDNSRYYKLYNYSNCILKADTIPVNEIKYEVESNVRCDTCVTSCNHKKNIMVGSVGCNECEYNCGDDKVNQTVQCSWQKETSFVKLSRELDESAKEYGKMIKESDKMDLKTIAVKFHGSEQREHIISVFKENGFKVPVIMGLGGFIGYADSCDYVCSLTEVGLKGKTIITYEQFIGGKEMKRLNIKEHYRDNVIHLLSKERKDGYAEIHIYNDSACIRIGENYLTLTQANAILKVMGLNYELYEGVDWSKVEEGAKVLVLDKKGIIDGYGGKFVKYIADIKKVIVRSGDEVYIIDEDKVELV